MPHVNIAAVYVCGSRRLTRDVARLQREYGFEGWVLMEERMACGIGACKGCVCRVKEDSAGPETEDNLVYKMVCVEGPAFKVERVVFD